LSLAYIDSSLLVAIGLEEEGWIALAERLDRFDVLFSANLLEAEFKAALAREGIPDRPDLLADINWIYPDRPLLSSEIARILAGGLLKGADLWHLACALYFAEVPRELSFLTLDRRQGSAAQRLGFPGL
jgi:hypothetical protein